MKQGLALLALGIAALVVQSVAALWLPARFVPDLGLLVVVAIALCLRNAVAGIVLAAVLGYVTDVLSGSLLGQQTLLRMGAYGAARVASAHLNMRGALPQALFVAGLSMVYAASLWGLAAFFAPGDGGLRISAGQLLPHVLITGLAAPPVTRLVAALLAWLGDDEGAQRLHPLVQRKYSA